MPLMKRCVLNFAKQTSATSGWYPRGQERLRQSLTDCDWNGDFLHYQDESQLYCPSHQLVPYGFKIAAFNEALRLGYTSALWCDASVWAIKPLEPVFEHIEKEGHILFHIGYNCAQWTNDLALKILNITRDEAEKMPMYMALCIGLNLQHPRSRQFLKQMHQHAFSVPTPFKGSWDNQNETESHDPRCRGHRHDQSVGSILAAQLGMELTHGQDILAYYTLPGSPLYVYGGDNDMTGISSSVILLAQGML